MATWIDYLIVFLRIVRFCVDYVVDLIFSLIYDRRPKAVIPPIDKPFLAYSGTKLAKLIRTKQLTSEEVTRAFAERCRQINSILNAIVDERFDDAIQDAKKVDEFLATTDMSESELAASKPFLGVPFTSKESTEAEGMSFTFGIISRKIQDMKGAVDSNVVNLLKQRGGILIAVTNVPELNLWCETRNNVFGQTVNCYDSRRTTGGSSGGEATLLAACGSAIGIGTDVGGSTRMPAYYCGIYGHKPTADLISTKGLTFRAGNETTTMVAAGPMSRHAEDLVPFLDVLVGENRSKLKLNDAVDLTNLRVFYICEPGDLKVSSVCSENQRAIRKAAEYLSTLTKKPAKHVDIPGFKYSQALWRHGMTKEDCNFGFDVGNREKEVTLTEELPKFLVGKSNHTLPVIMRLLDLNLLPQTNVEWAEKETSQLLRDVKDLLGDDGVLLFPSGPREAPYHYESFLRPYNFAYWGIFNALKIPATNVPMGFSKNGLPIGLQVVAGPYNDHLCLAVARELEKEFGGWVPPFISN
ncbi:Amidase [Nesidiocoris tenuis]|uniref:Amidase n=1 Tax=Nesidiocoris tenuis TaxID=355587 RepID=A0ABN7A6A4_9HEMI|nr:Amidase [Nesidiocoris tenuis]